jgi:hypothetical protein
MVNVDVISNFAIHILQVQGIKSMMMSLPLVTAEEKGYKDKSGFN